MTSIPSPRQANSKFKLLILRLPLLLVALLLSSCFMIPLANVSENAYYNITESSVRLVKKLGRDTILWSSYEEKYNPPCPLVTITNDFDTLSTFGIALKFRAIISMVNKKQVFYGYAPALGLLQKIHAIKIVLEGENTALDISDFIKGDSTFLHLSWDKTSDRNKYDTYDYISGGCYQIEYISDIKSLTNKMNYHANEIRRISGDHYVFWFDKSLSSKINFKPNLLTMTLTLVDSTGIHYREISDKWKLQTVQAGM